MNVLGDNPTIWVFGYGSLLWKPDFRFKSKKIGYIKDYERRFYQGNETFRGRPGQPGRVANLVENKGSQAWGVAYEISGREEVIKVLRNLYTREAACGGYVTMVTTFYPREEPHDRRLTGSHRIGQSSVTTEFQKSGNDVDCQFVYRAHTDYLHGIKRVNSDESLDGSSSDDDEDDSKQQNLRVTEILTSSERGTEDEFTRNVDSKDGEGNINYLMHYLHEFSNIKTEQFFMDFENDDHSYHESLSSTPKSSHLHRLHVVDSEHRPSPFPIQVLLYTATPDNDLYLGPADVSVMARQIVSASGSAGSNVEYVTKTADFVRKYIPEDQDSHLFSLDAKVREEVYKQHAEGSVRLQLGFADLNHDLYEMDVLAEPVMAS
ncbi:unnamed protein product [Candidula unifasciata]|uniref:glutathione-specific gamma-glutamylcyclotransferase n=1 Tax=Candidula unifasciata TaxID=100452 RepID=A0A8S3YN26_9EUPU|nr:unnamed protein product [Candidula unifasciata]